MSLWGSTDALASAPKWLTPTTTVAGTAFATTTITVPNHSFTTGDQVTFTNVDTDLTGTNVGSGIKYVKVLTTSTIELWGNAATDADQLSASNTAGTHTIQVTPSDVYLIDSTEATLKANQDKGLDSPGWYKYSTYNTSDAVTRHNTEQLVAFGEGTVAVTGDTGVDGTDDAVAFDRELTITSISAPAVDLANDVDIVATVVVAQSGVAGGTITFQWQKSTDDGANFTNISADATYTNVTTAVLTVTGSAVSDKVGEQYRCVVSLELALTRTSLPVIATQS